MGIRRRRVWSCSRLLIRLEVGYLLLGKMIPFRAAGFTYIKYSQICANSLSSCLKAEHQAAAQARATKTVIFRRHSLPAHCADEPGHDTDEPTAQVPLPIVTISSKLLQSQAGTAPPLPEDCVEAPWSLTMCFTTPLPFKNTERGAEKFDAIAEGVEMALSTVTS